MFGKKKASIYSDLVVYIFSYQISREKFEPEPGFEPRTCGFLAWRSIT